MARFVKEHTSKKSWFIGADLIFDYFEPLFKKDISNEYVHNIWLSAGYALDKCHNEDQKKIVKALAIILINNKDDEIPADDKYLSLCLDTEDFAEAISDLISNKMVYKKGSTGTYMFKSRAGSELKAEIKNQRELKGENVNYSNVLSSVTGNYFVIPRKYNTIHKMTRYFNYQYMDVKDFLAIDSAEALLSDISGDGKVISLYSFVQIKQDQVNKHLAKLADSRIVIICPKKGIIAKKQLKDYEFQQKELKRL